MPNPRSPTWVTTPVNLRYTRCPRQLADWEARSQSNVYAMMRSAHQFREILPTDPLASFALVEGDGRSVRRERETDGM